MVRILLVAVTLVLLGSLASAYDTDAVLIFGASAIDVASTEYVRARHEGNPRVTVSDLNPFCHDVWSCSAVNVGAGGVTYFLAKQQRKRGHKARARLIVWTWTGIKVVAVGINIRNAHRTR